MIGCEQKEYNVLQTAHMHQLVVQYGKTQWDIPLR